MALGFPDPWKLLAERKRRDGPRTVNAFLGFFLVLNTCVGTGFLGIPYAFFYSGYVVAIPTLLLVVFVTWSTANWEVETMARAQAVESFQKCRRPRLQGNSEAGGLGDGVVANSRRRGITVEGEGGRNNTGLCHEMEFGCSGVADVHDSVSYMARSVEEDTSPSFKSIDLQKDTFPDFRIRIDRKFEPTELCGVFFGWWMKLLYLLVVFVYTFLGFWGNATVAGSAWATNIPFHFGSLEKCDSDAFHHELIPVDDSCRNAYRFCIMIYAVIVVSLSLLNLKEQAFLQVVLGFMRFAMFICMILYTIVNLAEGGNACTDTDTYSNGSSFSNSTHMNNWTDLANRTGHFDFDKDILATPDWKGWLISVPVYIYALILHQAIPTLTHPIRQKKSLHWLIAVLWVVLLSLYLSLGVTIPLWFQGSIQENSSLNWVSLSKPGNHLALRVLSYYIVLFPSIDVSSGYPLVVHAVANNVFLVLFGRDTTKGTKHRFDWLIQLVLRFFIALLPTVGALFVSNLVYVIKYAGLLALLIGFCFPSVLQLQSQRVCKKMFGASYFLSTSHESSKQTHSRYGTMDKANGHLPIQETTHLLSPAKTAASSFGGKELYMTPHSYRVFSHPILVALLALVGVALSVVCVLALVYHPSPVTCQAST